MATTLFLRNTTTNGITDTGDGVVYDLVTTAGSAADTGVVSTAASGTNIQWTKTAGGLSMAWITGRVPAGGVTMTTLSTVSIWCHESNMNANAGARIRVYRYQPGGTVTELGAGPFDDGAEFGTAAAEMLWAANFTDQAFSENDRLLIRLFITGAGTMAAGHTCTVTFNAASAATGDSFVTLAETVAFKAEPSPTNVAPGTGTATWAGLAPTISRPVTVTAGLGTGTWTGLAPTVQLPTVIAPGVGTGTWTGFAPTVQTPVTVTPGTGIATWSGLAPSLGAPTVVEPGTGAGTWTGLAPTVQTPTNVAPATGIGTWTGLAPTIQTPVSVIPGSGIASWTGLAPTISLPVTVVPGVGQATWTGFAPSLGTPTDISPATGLGTWAGLAPTVQTPVTVAPGTGLGAWQGFAPTVVSGPVTVEPGTGVVIWTGFAPSVTTDVPAAPHRTALTQASMADRHAEVLVTSRPSHAVITYRHTEAVVDQE